MSLVSLNAEEDLAVAKRMVLVFATNALNSNMVFSDVSFREVVDWGKLPVLLETGKFKVKVRNIYAGKAKVYALGLDGARRYPVPVQYTGDSLELEIDTGTMPGGPSIYFEIVAD